MPGAEQQPAGHQRNEGQRQQGDRQRADDGVDVRRRCRIRQPVHVAAERPFGASRDGGAGDAVFDARATRTLRVQSPLLTLTCKLTQVKRFCSDPIRPRPDQTQEMTAWTSKSVVLQYCVYAWSPGVELKGHIIKYPASKSPANV